MKISGYIHGLIAVCSKYGDMYKNASGKMGQLAGRTLVLSLLVLLSGCGSSPVGYTPSPHDLVFDSLAGKWDEAVPLGNGQVGALVWQKGDRLRFSLDRVDLWDLRPTEGMTWDKPVYDWICEQWQNNTYGTVQELLDEPYGRLPAPSKIPAGALEFHTADWGAADSVRLYVQNAVCKVWWPSGRTLEAFVQSDGPCGWFRFTGIDSLRPEIVAPAYAQAGASAEDDAHSGQELHTLGYPQGVVHMKGRTITYVQPGWNGFQYAIAVTWKKTRGGIEGVWSVQSTYGGNSVKNIASDVRETLGEGYADAYKVHRAWWQRFWDKSVVSLPDSVLEKQWYLEQYKFGSAARADMPPITLQAVWTADNGKLPPWKGDFHHDLNTQLSYWPAYGANHLDEEIGFTNWLWSHRDAFRRYTEGFFGRGGLNVPGVTTLDGEPMGGWCQYSMSPTVSAWLGHHFYLHWRYSGDRTYLEERAYPWIAGTATFLEQLSVKDAQGRRRLPLGSSPEINDNRREAWFPTMTNYDLALTRFTFDKAAELAGALGKSDEAAHWRQVGSEWGDYVYDESGLNFAEGLPYTESHRHFSHLMAFHPLGLLDPSQGDSVRRILQNSMETLERIGPEWWCGYSYSWVGGMWARMGDGERAAAALRDFAQCFCLKNSFHANGDQSRSGKSNFTYRPFTLEGNMAFASSLQEMLLQSHTGTVRIFPAIPPSWKDVSFRTLRTEGAFLVSAAMRDGKVSEVKVCSPVGGPLRVLNTFSRPIEAKGVVCPPGEVFEANLTPGEELTLL